MGIPSMVNSRTKVIKAIELKIKKMIQEEMKIPKVWRALKIRLFNGKKRPKNIIVLGAGFDTLYFRANEKYLQSKNKKTKANKEKVSSSMRTKTVKSMEEG